MRAGWTIVLSVSLSCLVAAVIVSASASKAPAPVQGTEYWCTYIVEKEALRELSDCETTMSACAGFRESAGQDGTRWSACYPAEHEYCFRFQRSNGSTDDSCFADLIGCAVFHDHTIGSAIRPMSDCAER